MEKTPFILVCALALALASAPASATATAGKDVPIPKKIPSPVSESSGPTVTIHTGGNGDRIEEYREGGKLTMVRITPVRGKPYYLYDDNGDGRLDRSDADRHSIAPVYWTIYEWN